MGLLVDDGVADVVAAMGKGHVQKVGDSVDGEAVSLPIKVVMMGNGRHLSFRQKFGKGDAERQVHGNGEDVLRDEQFDGKALDELVKGCFEIGGEVVDSLRDQAVAMSDAPYPFVDPLVFRVGEVRFGNAHTDGGVAVKQTGVPIGGVAVFPEDLRPLCAFQGHSVVAGKAGGNEAHAMIGDRGGIESCHKSFLIFFSSFHFLWGLATFPLVFRRRKFLGGGIILSMVLFAKALGA